jgi:hypothetical protein
MIRNFLQTAVSTARILPYPETCGVNHALLAAAASLPSG